MMTSSSEKSGSEGRIANRHVFERRIRIRIEGKDLTVEGWTRNLSEGGVNAFVAHSLTRGEFVTLEVPLQNSQTQTIPAQVVRTLGTEYGFQFTALSMLQRAQIRATLREQPVIPHERKRR